MTKIFFIRNHSAQLLRLCSQSHFQTTFCAWVSQNDTEPRHNQPTCLNFTQCGAFFPSGNPFSSNSFAQPAELKLIQKNTRSGARGRHRWWYRRSVYSKPRRIPTSLTNPCRLFTTKLIGSS